MNNFKDQILPIIRSVRDRLLPYYGNIEVEGEKSNAHDLVTRLDKEIERYLCEEFKKVDPAITFVGEEFGGDREAKKFWLVDPIDGTLHFIRGIPFCTTMVALIEDGEVVFSAIYDFVSDIMYWAEKGKGAYREEEKIAISQRPVSGSCVGFEIKLDKPENEELRKKVRGRALIPSTLTAGYELVLVATGKIEGRIAYDAFGKDFDYAPGSLLVSEAGGVVTNIGSSVYDYRNTNMIAANKAVHDDFTMGDNAIFPIK